MIVTYGKFSKNLTFEHYLFSVMKIEFCKNSVNFLANKNSVLFNDLNFHRNHNVYKRAFLVF